MQKKAGKSRLLRMLAGRQSDVMFPPPTAQDGGSGEVILVCLPGQIIGLRLRVNGWFGLPDFREIAEIVDREGHQGNEQGCGRKTFV